MACPVPQEEYLKFSPLLDRLNGEFHGRVWTAIVSCWAQGVEVIPFMGVRDPWAQARYWRRSRSRERCEAQIRKMRDEWGAPWLAGVLEEVGPQPTGAWATNAVPGMSWHQWARACDLYVRNPDGSANWDGLSWGYRVMAEEMRRAGLTSGFFWRRQDPAHVQADARTILNGFFAGHHPTMDREMKRHWERGKGVLWVRYHSQDPEA